jgi:hypothetical protein
VQLVFKVLLDLLVFVVQQDQLEIRVQQDQLVSRVLLVRLAHRERRDQLVQQDLLDQLDQLEIRVQQDQLDLLDLLVLEDLLFQTQHQPDLQMVMFGLTLRMHLTLLPVFTFIIAMLMDVNGLNMETHSKDQQVQLEKLALRVQQVLQVP